jgi:hypothetical protein
MRPSSSPPGVFFRRLEAFLGRLESPRAAVFTVVLATLLAATSVGPHRALDDYVLGLIARGEGSALGLERGKLDLFLFTTGDPSNNRKLMDTGLMLPWWTDPHLRIAFFRPLSSLTHWLDERLWPASAVLMHAHSLAWFAALIGAVAVLYRRLEPSLGLAGLSLGLYAFDDAHGLALAWLANRNALIATLFGCLALTSHDASRRQGNRLAAVFAPALLLVGLLAGEAAIGVLGYLIAYALCRDESRPLKRALSVLPYLVVVGVWRVLWSRGGYGARGSGAYIDPLGDPVGFFRVLPARLVVMFHGQFSKPPSDLAFLAPPTQQAFLVVVATVTVVLVGWVLFRVVVVEGDRTTRFWAVGMGLSLLPLAATFPNDRLLLFAGVGAMPLLARLFQGFVARGVRGENEGRGRTLVILGLAFLHVLAAPPLLALRAAQMELFGVTHDRAARGIPSDPSVAGKTVVIVAAPTVIFANYIQAQRAFEGTPRPAHLYVLSSASSPIAVERSGEQAITLRPTQGFLYTPLEQHYRGGAPLVRGDRVSLSTMTADVVETGQTGRPGAVRFSFDSPRNDYVFVTWQHDRFVPFALPDAGRPALLPEEDFGKILMETAIGGKGGA